MPFGSYASASGKWKVGKERVGFTQQVNLTLRFPHISSCQINHLRHDRLEESARMAQSSR
jgi:hypothetical protein